MNPSTLDNAHIVETSLCHVLGEINENTSLVWMRCSAAVHSQMAYGFSGEDIDSPKLTVRGHAVVQKPADEMTMTIGVITENQDAREALRNNSEIMHGMIENLVCVIATSICAHNLRYHHSG